MLQTKLRLQGV